MPASRRYELLHWAGQSSSRYIIEDDYDCEFRLYGRPIPTLQSSDTAEKVIYINTFSKKEDNLFCCSSERFFFSIKTRGRC